MVGFLSFVNKNRCLTVQSALFHPITVKDLVCQGETHILLYQVFGFLQKKENHYEQHMVIIINNERIFTFG